ncbi:DNA-binding response regulator [Leucobacter sp. wl10]|nr:DNA-binding response regulator [Leucobacter sp. wl10]
MRAGLRLMVDGVDGIAVVGEAADGVEAIEAARELDPDVILMDIRMPRMNGIEATLALNAAGARARIVALTAFDTDDFLLGALRGGALSFLLKDADPEVVLGSIRDAAAGRARVSPAALSRLIALAARPAESSARSPAERAAAPPETITPREWEIGRLVARGLTNAEVADALHLGQATVKTHLASLFAKLHVTNRVQLAIRVLEHDG